MGGRERSAFESLAVLLDRTSDYRCDRSWCIEGTGEVMTAEDEVRISSCITIPGSFVMEEDE